MTTVGYRTTQRMVRKRSFPRQKDGLSDPPIYSAELCKFAKLQDEGKEPYGDAVLDKEQRLGKPSLYRVGLTSPPGFVFPSSIP